MHVTADLHLHGPHSRGTSRNITIENLEKYARIKGLNLLGTGDFTHPVWLGEVKEKLKEDGSGILRTQTGFGFILSAEVSNVYEQDKKTRKVHNVILAPSLETAGQVNELLSKHGNLKTDGRPNFFGMTCPELMENLMGISGDIAVIPAHCWTPWFGIFGSKSGFDSVEECFHDQTRHVFALETGLSSDPEMNWRLSTLDKYALVSFSDTHSYWPWRIGREASVFDMKRPGYKELMACMRERDPKRFLYTIEVAPAYGKYHMDGHRNCNVRLGPEESIKMNNTCPVCRRPLTIGVLHRVEELADRKEGHVPKDAVPFRRLLPLTEIISTVLGIKQLYSKRIWDEYNRLVKKFGNELNVLLHADEGEMRRTTKDEIAELVIAVRKGAVEISPGFDGVYGELAAGEKKGKVAGKGPQRTLEAFVGK